ncbi:MAG: thrombospondin type 3 repeat-containing protein [Candidatus Syntrophoarchaeum sp.]|nr:thrombospondin type 3 repeat-containing protein [Candidatus Syntrophoarchaeum sp.]
MKELNRIIPFFLIIITIGFVMTIVALAYSDTDGDGLNDGQEVDSRTDPTTFDKDRKGGWEYSEEDRYRRDCYKDYYERRMYKHTMFKSLFILGFVIWLFWVLLKE